jgi:hypothetical protein
MEGLRRSARRRSWAPSSGALELGPRARVRVHPCVTSGACCHRWARQWREHIRCQRDRSDSWIPAHRPLGRSACPPPPLHGRLLPRKRTARGGHARAAGGAGTRRLGPRWTAIRGRAGGRSGGGLGADWAAGQHPDLHRPQCRDTGQCPVLRRGARGRTPPAVAAGFLESPVPLCPGTGRIRGACRSPGMGGGK